MAKVKLSRRQLLTLFIVACVNFFCSACVSLQAPFYPKEAENKGATATEYGLVFGSFELVGFLTSPLFGKIVDRVGAKFLLSVGLIVSSTSTILFGLLDLISGRALFISLSFLLRICESLGATAAIVSGFSLIGSMFPDNVATIFATLETFYGFGYIVGPTIGGLLYNVGGFPLPFSCVGILTAMVAVSLLIFVPNITEGYGCIRKEGAFLTAFKDSSIAIDTISVMAFAISAGFYNATLEPHIRVFQISPVLTGFMFVISGGTYAIVSPIFGRIVDRVLKPKSLLIVGCVLNIISFSIIGPLPFLPIPSTLGICILALFIHGFALAAGNVATFIDSIRSAIEAGFPENISTYGLMSGIWTSAYALGAFIGPSVAGFLYDFVGFRYATIFVIVIHALLAVVLIVYKIQRRGKKGRNLNNNVILQDKDSIVEESDTKGYNAFASTMCLITEANPRFETHVTEKISTVNGNCKNHSYGSV
ncbi:MFS-type transporter SLC18B1-like [Planococcus citri]|uniref:MFS-type transporter SLC18B1-like n=1 Tax=Planococcus citri TaxID=170843 RepID=UPI0031FA1B1B